MTNRRWLCPQCQSGVLGPQRPRKDDVRRYCLACSAKTGRLVERTCPALDRKRESRSERRAALTRTKRQREIERRSTGGVDLLAEARRFAKLPALRGKLREFPVIELRRSSTKFRSSGHCWCSRIPARIVVTMGTDPYYPIGTMLHEIVHAALPWDGHSARFWSTLRQAAREAWPDATFDFLNSRDGWTTGRAIRNGIASHLGERVPEPDERDGRERQLEEVDWAAAGDRWEDCEEEEDGERDAEEEGLPSGGQGGDCEHA